jgi:hypothetical protein
MSEQPNVELSEEQRALVIEGLRYIRSARRLAFRDPLAPPDEKRESELRIISELMGRFEAQAQVAVPGGS